MSFRESGVDELELLLAELGPTPRASVAAPSSNSRPGTPRDKDVVRLSGFYSSTPEGSSEDGRQSVVTTTDLDDFLRTLETEGFGNSVRSSRVDVGNKGASSVRASVADPPTRASVIDTSARASVIDTSARASTAFSLPSGRASIYEPAPEPQQQFSTYRPSGFGPPKASAPSMSTAVSASPVTTRAPQPQRDTIVMKSVSQPQQSIYKGNQPTARKTPVREDLANLHQTFSKFKEFIPPAQQDPITLAEAQCFECREPIVGQVIKAQGKCYHPEHFACSNCQNPIGIGKFHEKDAGCLCPKCFQQLMCPRCHQCNEPITGPCVSALSKKWHQHHFVCTECQKPFGSEQFFPRNGLPYCKTHSVPESNPCSGCGKGIRGEVLQAMGTAWHPECFVCQYCRQTFNGQFYELNGQPYCETHFHQMGDTLCAGCGKAVTGRLIAAFGKKFHPEHFVCAFCMRPLPAGNYTENSGKPYCKPCHSSMFGPQGVRM